MTRASECVFAAIFLKSDRCHGEAAAGSGSSFCDALGVFASIVEDRKGTLCGLTSTEGYEHDFSKAERDGQFVGLCLDVDNQDDQTEDRLNKWIPQVLAEFGL